MKPKISVIIPTYNDEKDIDKCLSTLKNQIFKDYEIIIVDGHSKDRTVEIAKKYGVKIVYENIGTRGGACNIGAKKARGKIIVFTDADAYFPKDWLKKIWKEFEKDKDLIALGGNDIIDDNKSFFEKSVFQIDLAKKENILTDNAYKRIRGCNSSYKRNIFLNEKGFNPKLASIEETEFHYRLAKKGYKMKFNPKIIIYHRRRRDFRGLFKQFFRNGMGRINAIKVNKDLLSSMDIAPFSGLLFLIIYFIFLGVNLKNISILVGLFLIYILFKSFLIVLKTKNLKYILILPLIIATREIAFSLGIFYGIFKSKKPNKKM